VIEASPVGLGGARPLMVFWCTVGLNFGSLLSVERYKNESQKLERTKYTMSPGSPKLEGTRPMGPLGGGCACTQRDGRTLGRVDSDSRPIERLLVQPISVAYPRPQCQ